MDRRTIGTENPGRCGEVAAIERWPLVEVRLYHKAYIYEETKACYSITLSCRKHFPAGDCFLNLSCVLKFSSCFFDSRKYMALASCQVDN